MPETSADRSVWTGRRWLAALVKLLAGLLLPVGLYYLLRAVGVSVYLSLLASAITSAIPSVVSLIRDRRPDGLSTYLSTMVVGSVLVSLWSGSTRFLLARDAVLTGVTGVWFLASLWARRPLAYLFTKPLLQGRLRWPKDWDGLWEASPRFRRMWLISSLLYGIGTLLDAALRVVMAYTLPADSVPALSTALYAATTVVLIVATNLVYIWYGVHDPRSKLYAGVPAELITNRDWVTH
jgi:hypothetical protein